MKEEDKSSYKSEMQEGSPSKKEHLEEQQYEGNSEQK
jgi:hypothetical protein